MAAPYHKILSKLERAVVAYLLFQEAGTEADTLPGKQSLTKTLPVTIVWAKHYDPVEINDTEFTCYLTISCKFNAALEDGQLSNDQVAASNLRMGKVFGSFTVPMQNNGNEIPDITTAARAKAAADALLAPPGPDVDLADFTFLNVVSQAGDADPNEKGNWVDSMDLKVRCSPYAI